MLHLVDADPTWTWRLSWHAKPPVRDQPGRVSYRASAENYAYTVVLLAFGDSLKLHQTAQSCADRHAWRRRKRNKTMFQSKVVENID